jgi:choline dehydrogenase-like flavoprotein
MQKTVHIIGAGISGLSAAVRLANADCRVHLHEATQQAGAAAALFDAATNLTIDNGNHLLGQPSAVEYEIDRFAGLVGPKRAQFPFVDLSTGQRWQLDLGESRLPLWIFDETRRVPDTGVRDYLALMPLIWAAESKLVGDAIPCDGTLYQRLVQPLLLAALNVDHRWLAGAVGNAAGGGQIAGR